MSLRISEKTIGPNRAKPIARPPLARLTVAALAALVCVPHSASAGEPFDRSSFSRIEFSAGCAQKQWTLAPDNSLELLVAPMSQGECHISLPFYFPQDIGNIAAVSFEARSTRPGPYLKVGLQEDPNSPPVFSSRPPSEELRSRWMGDGARIRRLKEGWEPQQISAIHFRVFPNKTSHFGPKDRVMIRNIHFAGSYLASPAASTLDPAIPVAAPAAQAVKTDTRVPAPHSRRLPMLPSAAGKILMIVASLGLGLAIWAGRHPKRRRILSPLYEINMRTWKTRKDTHGVVAFGGFNNVTLPDLKAIKNAGFNTVWFMGIWEVGAHVRAISKNYAADFNGSPFAIYDYTVSSDLGTEAEFKELVQRAHTQRLSVVVDFVPNHMGLDSAWLNDHPEYFIHKVVGPEEADLTDEDLKQRYPGHFPHRTPLYPENDRRVPKTIMVAYGKDPYFYPWIDTAQLDYAHPGLRQKMIDILCRWSKLVDGVRCDMAMLMIREQIKNHRHPEMSWEIFNRLMPNEFWTEAIQAVKRVNPNFVFIAETYWSMEGFLQNLGFDYTYNKPLYEAICTAVHTGRAEGLMNFLRVLGTDFLKRSVHFLENHDEERAMNALGDERQRAAAAILCTLPGIALLYQGQMEGKRERMPVQRVIPLHQEPEHSDLRRFYKSLLKATSRPVFQEGRLIPLYSNNGALASYGRLDDDTKVLVIVNTSGEKQAGTISLMPGFRLHSGTQYRLNDLFYSFKTNTAGTVQPFYVYPGSKLINDGLYIELEPFDAHIFVVEARTAQTAQKVWKSTRLVLDEWPLNRVARRFMGTALTRSSDTNLAANPASRQQ